MPQQFFKFIIGSRIATSVTKCAYIKVVLHRNKLTYKSYNASC